MKLLLNRVNQYRSSIYEIARGVLRSRNRQIERNQELTRQVRELQLRVEQLASESQRYQKQVVETQQELAMERTIYERLRQQPIGLPSDLPLTHHTFGPKMISLCLNLSKSIGFRPTERAIEIIFAWLGIETKIPSWDAIRLVPWQRKAIKVESEGPDDILANDLRIEQEDGEYFDRIRANIRIVGSSGRAKLVVDGKHRINVWNVQTT